MSTADYDLFKFTYHEPKSAYAKAIQMPVLTTDKTQAWSIRIITMYLKSEGTIR